MFNPGFSFPYYRHHVITSPDLPGRSKGPFTPPPRNTKLHPQTKKESRPGRKSPIPIQTSSANHSQGVPVFLNVVRNAAAPVQRFGSSRHFPKLYVPGLTVDRARAARPPPLAGALADDGGDEQ